MSVLAREGAAMASEEALHVIVRSRAKPARPTPQLTRLCQLRSWICFARASAVVARAVRNAFTFFRPLRLLTRAKASRTYSVTTVDELVLCELHLVC